VDAGCARHRHQYRHDRRGPRTWARRWVANNLFWPQRARRRAVARTPDAVDHYGTRSTWASSTWRGHDRFALTPGERPPLDPGRPSAALTVSLTTATSRPQQPGQRPRGTRSQESPCSGRYRGLLVCSRATRTSWRKLDALPGVLADCCRFKGGPLLRVGEFVILVLGRA